MTTNETLEAISDKIGKVDVNVPDNPYSKEPILLESILTFDAIDKVTQACLDTLANMEIDEELLEAVNKALGGVARDIAWVAITATFKHLAGRG